jgi:hypothetical protein
VIIGDAVLGDHLPVTPDVVGRHHDLEEGIVVFELAEGSMSRPSRLASPTRYSTSARLSY